MGFQLVRDLYKGLTAESSHGFGTAPHTTWPSKGLSLIYLVSSADFIDTLRYSGFAFLSSGYWGKLGSNDHPTLQKSHVLNLVCHQWSTWWPPPYHAKAMASQGKARRTSNALLLFLCLRSEMDSCLLGGWFISYESCWVEKDLLTSCACWCKCLGFEACALLHQLTG